jgi:F-type H+-transporting ATPase subunit a
MPQPAWSTGSIGMHRQGAFQLAQGEPPKKEQSADQAVGTHAETGAEKEPPQGEVPDAVLLFWNSALVAFLMLVFALVARRRLETIPRGIQNWAEYAVEQLNGFTVGIIGEGGEKYTPLIGTVFLYIFLMNLIGLIPGLHSPTANITITLALGVVVFLYSEYVGIRNRGLVGHFKHFMGPKLGNFPWLFPLMLPVELISTYVRPLTLAVRLFGNIFGEDVIIGVLAGLGATLAGSALGWVPFQFPLLLLAILTSGVQALVFSMLVCIYISLNSHHEEGEHGEEGPVSGTAHAHGAGH